MSLTFSKSGRKISKAKLDAAESELGVPLPIEYRRFMLTTNGGCPKPSKLTWTKRDAEVTRFYSIQATSLESDLVAVTRSFRDELGLPKQWLPIAITSLFDIVVLAVSGKSIGQVSLWSSIASGFERRRVTTINKSFDGFLGLFAVPSMISPAALLDRLETAMIRRDEREIRQIIAKLDFHRLPKDLPHPLESAIQCRQPNLVRLLIELGVPVKFKDPICGTPLEQAKMDLDSQKLVLRFDGLKKTDYQKAEQAVAALTEIVALLRKAK